MFNAQLFIFLYNCKRRYALKDINSFGFPEIIYPRMHRENRVTNAALPPSCLSFCPAPFFIRVGKIKLPSPLKVSKVTALG